MGFRGVLGHEFVGEVVECEEGDWIGKRVVGEINCSCGTCEFCHKGRRNHCPHRTVLGILNRDGAFAEYLRLPLQNLVSVPDSLPDEEAVFTEPLAAAFEIPQQVTVGTEDRTAVIGDGKLGLLTAQVLRLFTPHVHLVGKHPEHWEFLSPKGIRGIHLEQLKQEPEFDLVVEASGSPAGLETALALVRPRGTLVLKSTMARVHPPSNWNLLVINEIHAVGSRCGPFRPALDALKARSVDVRPLIHGTYPLSEGVAALRRAGQKGMLKIQLVMNG
jgi:threonine dehydrogenase-like Zn-dependent dehydrogenase